MKKLITTGVLFFVLMNVFAQANKNVAAKANSHIKVFQQAAMVGDINTAISALNYYTSEQGANNPYADTLAMLYLQQGSFAQCYFWSERLLSSKPNDLNLLEMKGVCLDKLQQPKEAIDVFEKLLAKTKSPFHAYKLMELQYSIKRIAECVATGLAAEKLQYKPEYVVSYNVGEQVGRTYLQASMYNIQALALYDLDKKAEAKTYLQKALQLDSNFVLAKQNLAALNSTLNGGTPKTNNTNVGGGSPANKQN